VLDSIAKALQANLMQTASQPLDLSWGATEAYLAGLNRNTLDPLWDQRRNALISSSITKVFRLVPSLMTPRFGISSNSAQMHTIRCFCRATKRRSTISFSNICSRSMPQLHGGQADKSGRTNLILGSFKRRKPVFSRLIIRVSSSKIIGLKPPGAVRPSGELLKGIPAIAGLSDRRDKTDIEKLGTDEPSGLDAYAYRYKGDPKTYPKVVGPMA
jgi:hypothetical protein